MSVSKVDDETRAHLLVSRVEAAVQRYRSGYEETDKERYSRDLVGWRPEFGFSPKRTRSSTRRRLMLREQVRDAVHGVGGSARDSAG